MRAWLPRAPTTPLGVRRCQGDSLAAPVTDAPTPRPTDSLLQEPPVSVASVFSSYFAPNVGLTFQTIKLSPSGNYGLRECWAGWYAMRHPCCAWRRSHGGLVPLTAAPPQRLCRSCHQVLGPGAGQRCGVRGDQKVEHDGAAAGPGGKRRLARRLAAAGPRLTRGVTLPPFLPSPLPQSTITFSSNEVAYKQKMCTGKKITWRSLQVWVETAAGEGERLNLPNQPVTEACL